MYHVCSGNEQNKDAFFILKDVDDEDMSQIPEQCNIDTVDFVRSNGSIPNKVVEDSRDPIAEPLFALLSELFDMKGFFKYLRKTLIGMSLLF